MRCAACGKDLHEKARFCGACGARAPKGAEAAWSKNAIASAVALFICIPMSPLLAVAALRECARTPGMRGRGLAIVVLALSLISLGVMAYAFVQGWMRAAATPR
jgi:hypothetical protein